MPAVQTLSRLKAKTDARHLMRYLRSQAGTELAAIAKEDNVSVKTVRESVAEMERYVSRNSEGQLQLAVRDLVISMIPQAKETLGGLLRATTLVEVKNRTTGKVDTKEIEDKITRTEAVKLMTGLISVTQPKVPQVALNVNQNNQTAVLSSAETTEERLRRLKRQAAEHNLLPPVVAGVPEHIDKGFDPDDDDGDEDDD